MMNYIINNMVVGWMFSRTRLDCLNNHNNIPFKNNLMESYFNYKDHYLSTSKGFNLNNCLWEWNMHWESSYESTMPILNHHAQTCRIAISEHCSIKVCFVLTWHRWTPPNRAWYLNSSTLQILGREKILQNTSSCWKKLIQRFGLGPRQRALHLFHKSQAVIIEIFALKSLATGKKLEKKIEKSPGGIVTEHWAQLRWPHRFSNSFQPHIAWRVSSGWDIQTSHVSEATIWRRRRWTITGRASLLLVYSLD